MLHGTYFLFIYRYQFKKLNFETSLKEAEKSITIKQSWRYSKGMLLFFTISLPFQNIFCWFDYIFFTYSPSSYYSYFFCYQHHYIPRWISDAHFPTQSQIHCECTFLDHCSNVIVLILSNWHQIWLCLFPFRD